MKAMHLRSHLPANHRLQAVDIKEDVISVPEVIQFTAKIGDVRDAVHVCIAKHEDLYLVTKDDGIGKVQEIYPKTIGMIGFMKAFE